MHHRPRDIDLQLFKINVHPLETDQLAATQPGNPIEGHQRLLAKRKLLQQGLEFRNLKHIGNALPLGALPDLADGVRILRKPFIPDGVIEQSVHDVPDLCLGPSCHPAAVWKSQRLQPTLNRHRADILNSQVAPATPYPVLQIDSIALLGGMGLLVFLWISAVKIEFFLFVVGYEVPDRYRLPYGPGRLDVNL